MEIIHAIILGVVEGFTEFLPISSTAHLLIATRLLGLIETEFVKTFVVVIQLGAIAGVIALYLSKVLSSATLMKKILVAFVPTAVIGFVLYNIIKDIFFENFFLMGAMLLVGGIILLFIEKKSKKSESATDLSADLSALTYRQAFYIGCFQALAVIPGVSRAAATIIGGLLLGVSREAIVMFSFLLAIPTMVAAAGYDLLKTSPSLSGDNYTLLAVGFITAFVFGIIGVKFLLKIVSTKSLAPFGWYRIILALALMGYLAL